MDPIENIRLSLDEIGDALKRLSSGNKDESQSLKDFHSKISAFFPHIQFESNDSLWDDKLEEDETFTPLWWDDLDEPFELGELHWLSKIQKYELLNPEKVRETVESIEAGVFAEAALSGEFPFDIAKYGSEKVERVAALGKQAFEYMIVHNLKLALHIAKKYARKVEIEDAFQYAVFGLMHAIRKFDWRLGHQFSTYATWWIRQSISREIANNEFTIRLPVHMVERINQYKRELHEIDANFYTTASEVTIKNKFGKTLRVQPALASLKLEVDSDESFWSGLKATFEPLDFWDTYHQAPWLLKKYEQPDDSNMSIEFATMCHDLLERLTYSVLTVREVEILELRYGISCSEPMTLDEIGKIYDLTRERIRQIEAKALKRVESFLQGVDLQNYWDAIEEASIRFHEKLARSPEAISILKQNQKSKKDANRFPVLEELLKMSEEKRRKKVPSVFVTANFNKTILASKSQVLQLVWALEKTQDEVIPKKTIEIARRRIGNPQLSLRELAQSFEDPKVTKDVIASSIRRLIAKAKSVSGESPPLTI